MMHGKYPPPEIAPFTVAQPIGFSYPSIASQLSKPMFGFCAYAANVATKAALLVSNDFFMVIKFRLFVQISKAQ